MSVRPLPGRWIRFAAPLGAVLLAVACYEAPVEPGVEIERLEAKGGVKGGGGNGGGKGGGGDGSDPTVAATDPSSALQNTSLTVRVVGAGFDETSEAAFLLDGKSTNHIVTHATRFVSDTEVEADISVAFDAAVDLYDVEVTAAGGRKRGIGIELFEVQPYYTEVSGGMEASRQGLEKVTESNSALSTQDYTMTFQARVNLANTRLFAIGNPDLCQYESDDAAIPEAEARDSLIALLVDEGTQDKSFEFHVEKAEALEGTFAGPNLVELGGSTPDQLVKLVSVGRQGGIYGFPQVTYDDGDGDATNNAETIDDPTTATRIFTFSPSSAEGGPGTVAVRRRWPVQRRKKVSTWPLVKLLCPLQGGDEITVTIIPGSIR